MECKQVLDDGNNFTWRQKPTQQITASQVKDKSYMSDNVLSDKAYRFLKNVRDSPPYYQRTFYELLAMIRQLVTPTWFFTLSAADMYGAPNMTKFDFVCRSSIQLSIVDLRFDSRSSIVDF